MKINTPILGVNYHQRPTRKSHFLNHDEPFNNFNDSSSNRIIQSSSSFDHTFASSVYNPIIITRGPPLPKEIILFEPAIYETSLTNLST